MNIYVLSPNEELNLYDPEAGYQHSTYTYKGFEKDKYIFLPKDPTRGPIIRRTLEEVIAYHHPLFVSSFEKNMLCTKCTNDNCTHYPYNSYTYKDTIILPMEKIQFNPHSISNERLSSIFSSVLLPPINVTYCAKTENYTIENGNHRYLYSLQKGFDTIPCIIDNI